MEAGLGQAAGGLGGSHPPPAGGNRARTSNNDASPAFRPEKTRDAASGRRPPENTLPFVRGRASGLAKCARNRTVVEKGPRLAAIGTICPLRRPDRRDEASQIGRRTSQACVPHATLLSPEKKNMAVRECGASRRNPRCVRDLYGCNARTGGKKKKELEHRVTPGNARTAPAGPIAIWKCSMVLGERLARGGFRRAGLL